MSDLRTNVSAPVHRVLDLLDKGRGSWATFSKEGLQREISIEAEALGRAGPGPQSASARRLAALLLFAIEQADAPDGAA